MQWAPLPWYPSNSGYVPTQPTVSNMPKIKVRVPTYIKDAATTLVPELLGAAKIAVRSPIWRSAANTYYGALASVVEYYGGTTPTSSQALFAKYGTAGMVGNNKAGTTLVHCQNNGWTPVYVLTDPLGTGATPVRTPVGQWKSPIFEVTLAGSHGAFGNNGASSGYRTLASSFGIQITCCLYDPNLEGAGTPYVRVTQNAVVDPETQLVAASLTDTSVYWGCYSRYETATVSFVIDPIKLATIAGCVDPDATSMQPMDCPTAGTVEDATLTTTSGFVYITPYVVSTGAPNSTRPVRMNECPQFTNDMMAQMGITGATALGYESSFSVGVGASPTTHANNSSVCDEGTDLPVAANAEWQSPNEVDLTAGPPSLDPTWIYS